MGQKYYAAPMESLEIAKPLTKDQEDDTSSTEIQDHSWKTTESREKAKKAQESLKSIFSTMSAYVSSESWRAIDARLQSIAQKGERDNYFGAANESFKSFLHDR